jgi:hypothetical protein
MNAESRQHATPAAIQLNNNPRLPGHARAEQARATRMFLRHTDCGQGRVIIPSAPSQQRFGRIITLLLCHVSHALSALKKLTCCLEYRKRSEKRDMPIESSNRNCDRERGGNRRDEPCNRPGRGSPLSLSCVLRGSLLQNPLDVMLERSVHSGTLVLLTFCARLPSTEATGRWKERGRMRRGTRQQSGDDRDSCQQYCHQDHRVFGGII